MTGAAEDAATTCHYELNGPDQERRSRLTMSNSCPKSDRQSSQKQKTSQSKCPNIGTNMSVMFERNPDPVSSESSCCKSV